MSSTIATCPQCATRSRVPAVAKGRPRCPQCKASLPWIAEADDQSFDAVADAGQMPVLVDLWAPWCGPCRQISPWLEKLAAERAGKLKLVKVNVDKAPGTMTAFGAQAIPTLILFKGLEEVGRQTGGLPPQQLTAWLGSALS